MIHNIKLVTAALTALLIAQPAFAGSCGRDVHKEMQVESIRIILNNKTSVPRVIYITAGNDDVPGKRVRHDLDAGKLFYLDFGIDKAKITVKRMKKRRDFNIEISTDGAITQTHDFVISNTKYHKSGDQITRTRYNTKTKEFNAVDCDREFRRKKGRWDMTYTFKPS